MFVWLFGALVSMRAGHPDLQEIFWDLAVHRTCQKINFVSVHPRGMVDPSSDLALDPRKIRFGGTLGTMNQRLRLVITVILGVFRMD